MTSTFVLYAVWFLLPAGFLLMALWSLLERMAGKTQLQDNASLFKQSVFVLACVLVSIALDHYALEWVSKSVFQEVLPLGFFRVIVLPIVLLIGAKLIGPSADIRIQRAPHPSDRRAKSKPRRGAKS
jgi:hypothetical protein